MYQIMKGAIMLADTSESGLCGVLKLPFNMTNAQILVIQVGEQAILFGWTRLTLLRALPETLSVAWLARALSASFLAVWWPELESVSDPLVPNMCSHVRRPQAGCAQAWHQAALCGHGSHACPSSSAPAPGFPSSPAVAGSGSGHRSLQCPNWPRPTEVSALLQVCWSFCWMRGT